MGCISSFDRLDLPFSNRGPFDNLWKQRKKLNRHTRSLRQLSKQVATLESAECMDCRLSDLNKEYTILHSAVCRKESWYRALITTITGELTLSRTISVSSMSSDVRLAHEHIKEIRQIRKIVDLDVVEFNTTRRAVYKTVIPVMQRYTDQLQELCGRWRTNECELTGPVHDSINPTTPSSTDHKPYVFTMSPLASPVSQMALTFDNTHISMI
jgi:hypothetical protein